MIAMTLSTVLNVALIAVHLRLHMGVAGPGPARNRMKSWLRTTLKPTAGTEIARTMSVALE